jgi:hypothetical protein
MFAFSNSRPPVSAELAARLRPVALAGSRLLPVDELWTTRLPERGLRRGTTTVVTAPEGTGGVTLALSLVSGASRAGHWSAVIGVEDPGVAAVADLGVDLRRVVFVPRPRGAWAEVAADTLDGVDLLVVRPPARAPHTVARRLVARVRESGCGLIVVTDPLAPWPIPADVSLTITSATWVTDARLLARRATVRVSGRGGARPHEFDVTVPDGRGRVAG